ncbi:MAG: hypothetical protein RL582_1899 [Bacteroidota bacterium]|jgi:hypothetical protein
MEKLISAFLFKNQYCPLPGVGTLTLVHESAQIKSDEHILLAPKQNIVLQSFESDPSVFIQFISRRKNKSIESASTELHAFCNSLSTMGSLSKWELPSTGQFFVNESGQLQFRPEELPEDYSPSVTINRVVHPSAVHKIMVGDHEKGSDEMLEELQQNKTKKGSKAWIIWLTLMILLLGAAFAGLWFAEDIERMTGFEIPFRIR